MTEALRCNNCNPDNRMICDALFQIAAGAVGNASRILDTTVVASLSTVNALRDLGQNFWPQTVEALQGNLAERGCTLEYGQIEQRLDQVTLNQR